MNKVYFVITELLLLFLVGFIIWLKPNSNNADNNNNNMSDVVNPIDNIYKINNEQNLSNENSNDINKPASNNNKVSENTIKTASIQSFAMPNSDWQSREINGINYVFGVGNPKEVALQPSEYTGEGKWQNYVTPETEIYLKEFLTNQNLKVFVDRCGDKLGLTNNDTMQGFNITHSNDLDINKLLLVNTTTGRKQFDDEKIDAISQILWQVSTQLEGESAINTCMTGREIEGFNQLQDTFNKLTQSYINQPSDGFYEQNNPESAGYDIIQKTREMMGISTE